MLADACSVQQQMLLVGLTFKLKLSGKPENVDYCEFRPNGDLILRRDEGNIEDAWGDASSAPNRIILGGRRVAPIEMDIVFARGRCCQIEQLVETTASHAQRQPIIGVCVRDDNEPMHLERCPAGNATIRIELIVDGSLRKFETAMVAGLNSFTDILRKRTQNPEIARLRLHIIGDHIKTAWRCTPIQSTPRVTPIDIAIAASTGGQFLDGLGNTLSPLPMEMRRVVCIVAQNCDAISQKFSRSMVSRMVTAHRQCGWVYIYMSLYNPRANFSAEQLGVSAETCATFRATSAGVRSSLSLAAVAAARSVSGESPSFANTERAAGFEGHHEQELEYQHTPIPVPNPSRLELIIDGSGSMRHLRLATVNCLNNMIEALRNSLPDADSTLVQLHSFGEIVHSRWPDGMTLSQVPRITEKDLVASNKTALIDAIAITLSGQPPSEVRTVCIVTDGRDTASHQHTMDKTRDLIRIRRKSGWTILFLNVSDPLANATGASLGVDPSLCKNFKRSPPALRTAFSLAVSSIVRAATGKSTAFQHWADFDVRLHTPQLQQRPPCKADGDCDDDSYTCTSTETSRRSQLNAIRV